MIVTYASAYCYVIEHNNTFQIEQCNYHGLNEVFFLACEPEAIISDYTVAIFKVKKKGGAA